MAGNTDPIYSRVGDVSTNGTTGMSQAITAAAADFTGAGANNVLVWTADATNGGFLQKLRAKAVGTNAATSLRVFINNGSANTTAANNTFYTDTNLPSTAGAVGLDIDIPMNIALNPGFRIYVGLSSAVAAGWVVTGVGGKY